MESPLQSIAMRSNTMMKNLAIERSREWYCGVLGSTTHGAVKLPLEVCASITGSFVHLHRLLYANDAMHFTD